MRSLTLSSRVKNAAIKVLGIVSSAFVNHPATNNVSPLIPIELTPADKPAFQSKIAPVLGSITARQKIASIYTYNGKVTGWKPDIPFLQYSFYNSVALTDSVVYLAGSGVEALSKRTGKRISQRWALGATPSSDVIEVNPKHRHVYIGGRFSTIYDGNNYYPIPFFIVRPYAEDIATTVEETPYVEIPRNYILHQNYPNPFNPTTRIEFEIPQKEHVKLTIYDILGREVMKLIDGEFNAGRYSVDVNMSGYPSGVYFYRLEAGKFTSVKKMMLIK